MSRSGYSEDIDDNLQAGRWRGRVASAMRGKRGQQLLRELRDALDAMPEKRLISDELVTQDGEYCALGVLGAKRGIDMENLDPEDGDQVGEAFGIAPCMAQEIVYENDEQLSHLTPKRRWIRMRAWVDGNIARTEEERRAEYAIERDIASKGWIRTGWNKIPQEGTNVEISEDGKTVSGTANYIHERKCMLAGSAGGYGYYGIGFATDGKEGEDKDLIMDEPNYWRYHRAI